MVFSICGHPLAGKTQDGWKVVCVCLMSVSLLMSADIHLKERPHHHSTDGGGRSEVLMIITVLHRYEPLMHL